jgi:hypothetical protein
MRHLKVIVVLGGDGVHNVGGRLQEPVPIHHGDADRACAIQAIAAARIEVLAVPILAPVDFGCVPGEPEPVAMVANQRYIRVVSG